MCPEQPLRPSSPQDGVGPLIRRRYWVELTGAARPAAPAARATVRSEIVPSASGTLSREHASAAVRGLDKIAPAKA